MHTIQIPPWHGVGDLSGDLVSGQSSITRAFPRDQAEFLVGSAFDTRQRPTYTGRSADADAAQMLEVDAGRFDDALLPGLDYILPDAATRESLRRRARARIASDYRQIVANWAVGPGQAARVTARGALVHLMHSLADKDPGTSDHSARVARLATDLTMRINPGDREFADCVRLAALLHDIGKLEIPTSILCKSGGLTASEVVVVRAHPETGARTLESLTDAVTVAMVRGHHEHIDGRGYPYGLCGDDIPLGARIIAVVDAYDAMTSNRPYRSEMAGREVIGILRSGSGTQWDGDIVDAFVTMQEERATA